MITSSKFPLGTRVRKLRGAQWQGIVVGHYSTSLTPDGVAVESERELGSVQIYPVAAVEEMRPSIESIRQLRSRTGAPITACRDALNAEGGDESRAEERLAVKRA